MTTDERRDAYAEVTRHVVEALEHAGEWDKPWTSIMAEQPRNVRGSSYRGINTVLLGAIAARRCWPTVWGTYKAWGEIGGQVRRGERGSPCVFWKFLKVEKDGKIETIPMARLYSVFNLAQVDGVDPARFERPVREPTDMTGLDDLTREALAYCAADHVPVVHHDPNRAYYSRSADAINLPPASSFRSPLAYASTLLHECAHSTGHASRLDRTFGDRFGDDAYAVEEVVAELAAAMALGGAGHRYEVQHSANYLAHWLGVLRRDNRAVFTAASAAQKAADRILAAAQTDDEVAPAA